ncbi:MULTISPECIES: hypothetical protein [Tsukamurella]|mgnify:CR=1 FL=1|uniref:hypothetical protein n=1 Tax=Tsukamurella TaxID=2060 RepID=UPI00131582A2|nr:MULTISPECIES: hypothetical protein [Tsukamurella]
MSASQGSALVIIAVFIAVQVITVARVGAGRVTSIKALAVWAGSAITATGGVFATLA